MSAVIFPILFSALFVWSFVRPASMRLPFSVCIGAFIIFLAAYACYTIEVVRMLLEARRV
jgi:hypothetical protein